MTELGPAHERELPPVGPLRRPRAGKNPVDDRVVVRLRTNVEFLTQALDTPPVDDAEPVLMAYKRLRRSMILAERDAVLTARAEGRYQEPAVRTALASIDLEETALKANRPRKPGSREATSPERARDYACPTTSSSAGSAPSMAAISFGASSASSFAMTSARAAWARRTAAMPSSVTCIR